MFWRKKSVPRQSDLTTCARALYEFLFASLRDERGVRVEDLISAAATIVGERCIEAAGDFPVRTHTMAPGTRVFSDKINQLLCGDAADGEITTIAAESVFGTLRDRLVPKHYAASDFPSLREIFQHFAAGVGNQDE